MPTQTGSESPLQETGTQFQTASTCQRRHKLRWNFRKWRWVWTQNQRNPTPDDLCQIDCTFHFGTDITCSAQGHIYSYSTDTRVQSTWPTSLLRIDGRLHRVHTHLHQKALCHTDSLHTETRQRFVVNLKATRLILKVNQFNYLSTPLSIEP